MAYKDEFREKRIKIKQRNNEEISVTPTHLNFIWLQK